MLDTNDATLVTTVHADNNMGRAEVYTRSGDSFILYYDNNGHKFHEEKIEGSVSIAESKAEDWAMGYEVLYG